MIALPLLRPLRLLRLIPLLSVLNRRAHDQAARPGRRSTWPGGASLLAFCAALAVLDVERSSPDANISDFGDAIWWAVTTMTTVGYGDHYPVTAVGRLVAFGLMIGGIALLGTVTATLASWLVETVAAEKEQAEDLQVTVRRLEAKIDRLAAEPRTPDPEPAPSPRWLAGCSAVLDRIQPACCVQGPSRPASLQVTISRPPSIRSAHPIGTHKPTTPRPEVGGPLHRPAPQVWRSPWPCPLHRSLL